MEISDDDIESEEKSGDSRKQSAKAPSNDEEWETFEQRRNASKNADRSRERSASKPAVENDIDIQFGEMVKQGSAGFAKFVPASMVQHVRSDKEAERLSFGRVKATSTVPQLAPNVRTAELPPKPPIDVKRDLVKSKEELEEQWSEEDEVSLPLGNEEKPRTVVKAQAGEDHEAAPVYTPSAASRSGTRPRAAKELPEDSKGRPSRSYSNRGNEKKSVKDKSDYARMESKVSQSFGPVDNASQLAKYKAKAKELSKALEDIEQKNEKLEAEVSARKSADAKLRLGDTTEFKDLHKKLKAKQQEEVESLKAEGIAEIKRVQELNAKQLSELEAKRENALKFEQESWKKEKKQVKELHEMNVDSLERQHKYDMGKAKRELEAEIELPASYQKHEAEFSKLTNHANYLMGTMRNKVSNEFNDKRHAMGEREILVEESKRRNELEETKIALDKKKLLEAEKKSKERRSNLKEELEGHKALCDTKKDSLENQYKETLKGISEQRKQIRGEYSQLEQEKHKLDKIKTSWEAELAKKKMDIDTEYKLFDSKQKNFDMLIGEDLKHSDSKAKKLNAKRQEITREQTRLLERQQECEIKRTKLKHAYDELQTDVDKYCYELRLLEAERAKLEAIALQIEEDSRVIYKYKSATEDIKDEMEKMRQDIDTKEATLRNEASAFDYVQGELDIKQSALLSTQTLYFKEKHFGGTQTPSNLIKLPRDVGVAAADVTNKGEQRFPKRKQRKLKTSRDPFKAEEFVRELEKTHPKYPSYIDYIVSERSELMKQKQGLDPRASQRAIELHYRERINL